MEELEQILREHAKRYPLMQPTDAVKYSEMRMRPLTES